MRKMAGMKFEQTQKLEELIVQPPEVELEVRQNKRFVLVNDDYDREATPDGYSLVDHAYRDRIVKALIRQSVMSCMGHIEQEGGDPKQALRELSAFCKDGEAYEERGRISPQAINWIGKGREDYVHCLATILTSEKSNGSNEIVFSNKRVGHLMLDHPYVAERLKTIAALALGVDAKELQSVRELSQFVVHETYVPSMEQVIVPQLRCDFGSRMVIKQQYVVRTIIGTAAVKTLDLNMAKIENEIHDYIHEKGTPLDGFDRDLIRQRINMEYIVCKDPNAQLPIIMQ